MVQLMRYLCRSRLQLLLLLSLRPACVVVNGKKYVLGGGGGAGTGVATGAATNTDKNNNNNTTSAGAGGDPHFRTYNGIQYSYHGKCDIVLTRSDTFDNGTGLKIHARTDIHKNKDWSYISNVAIRIGSKDIFEVALSKNYGSDYYYNGIKNPKLPLLMSEKYTVENRSNRKRLLRNEIQYIVRLNDDNLITISIWKKMISIRIDANLTNTEGMLGQQQQLYKQNQQQHRRGLLGRDQTTIITNPNDIGNQWQVTDTEPMLFHEIRSPQYPERCITPITKTTDRRLLYPSPVEQPRAEVACSNIQQSLRIFCIEDILRTGDYELGNPLAYSF